MPYRKQGSIETHRSDQKGGRGVLKTAIATGHPL
jgi:hypothetical protein